MGIYLFADEDGAQIPSPHRHVLGPLYIFVALAGWAIQIPIVSIFLLHPKFQRQSCYRTMATIGIYECILGTAYFGIGVFTLTLDTYNYYVENLVIALVDTAKYGIYLSTTLLAFNRLAVMSGRCLTSRFYNVVLILIAAYCLSFYCLIFTRYNSYVFLYDLGMITANTFDPNDIGPHVFVDLIRYVSICCVCISVLLYVFTLLALLKQKMSVTRSGAMSSAEIRLLLSAFVTFLVCAIDVLCTYYLICFVDVRSIGMIVLMLLIFLLHPKFQRQSCYRTMATIGIYECILGTAYFGFGVCTLTLDTYNYYVENLVSALSDTAKYGIYLSTTLLAFNRLAVMSGIRLSPMLYNVALVLIAAYCLSFYCLIFTRYNSYVFLYDLGMITANTFDPNDIGPHVFVDLIRYVSICCVCISVLLYVFTLLALLKQKMSVTRSGAMSSAEIRLLLSAFVTFLVCAIDVLCTYYLICFVDVRSIGMIVLMLLIICSLFDASMYGKYLSIMLLALNRFSVIAAPTLLTSVFYHASLIAILLFSTGYYSLAFTPFLRYDFVFDLGVMTMSQDESVVGRIPSVLFYLSFVCLGSSLLLYVLIVIALMQRKWSLKAGGIISSLELRVLFTAFMTFIVCAVELVITHYAASIFPVTSVEFIVSMLISQCNSGCANPIIYVIMSRELRNVILRKRVQPKAPQVSYEQAEQAEKRLQEALAEFKAFHATIHAQQQHTAPQQSTSVLGKVIKVEPASQKKAAHENPEIADLLAQMRQMESEENSEDDEEADTASMDAVQQGMDFLRSQMKGYTQQFDGTAEYSSEKARQDRHRAKNRETLNAKKSELMSLKRLSQTEQQKSAENAKRRATRQPMTAQQKQQKAQYDKARKAIKKEEEEEQKKKEKMTVLSPVPPQPSKRVLKMDPKNVKRRQKNAEKRQAAKRKPEDTATDDAQNLVAFTAAVTKDPVDFVVALEQIQTTQDLTKHAASLATSIRSLALNSPASTSGPRRKRRKTKGLTKIHYKTCQLDHPGRGCAAQSATHRVPPWSPGTFNIPCQHCGARMNPPEKRRGWQGCCHGGKVDAEHMKRMFYLLQNPPQLMKELTDPDHVNARDYLANDRKINAHFAMGSITTNRDTTLPRGPNVVKLNNEMQPRLSDLCRSSKHEQPTFGQYYALKAEEAINYRLKTDIGKGPLGAGGARSSVIAAIDRIIRQKHALASSYSFAAEKFEEACRQAELNNEPIPTIRMTLLNNREAKLAGVQDPNIHTHRTEIPATEQVAVIWISNDDNARPPDFHGIDLHNTPDGTVNMGTRGSVPLVLPTCFPILDPFGLQGYRFGLPNKIKEDADRAAAEAASAMEVDGEIFYDARDVRTQKSQSSQKKADSKHPDGEAEDDEQPFEEANKKDADAHGVITYDGVNHDMQFNLVDDPEDQQKKKGDLYADPILFSQGQVADADEKEDDNRCTQAIIIILLLTNCLASASASSPKFRLPKRLRNRTEVEIVKVQVPAPRPTFSYMLKQPIITFFPVHTERFQMRQKIRKLSNRFSLVGF
ncbi:hypothetical protein QR680_010257 [Steinernema hermaphroditum]|uniref:G-protein coupled receptors family 1 profile domain-containing protein n=1 Tax=Steinernema hermaphroditum TaxID=289476 RepID=A0AA39INC3_9BILA|nr:hypothetical protein QR680_010257 [Steinernema hermaphroditum]